MKLKYTLAALAATTLAANAATTIVNTGNANNQGDLLTAAGQTFTTGILGTDSMLSMVSVQGPQSLRNPLSPNTYTAKVWLDTDGDATTWDPGTLVATSTNSGSFDTVDAFVTFNFSNEQLNDNTVYVLSFTNGTDDHAAFRAGVTNAGSGYAGGAVFQNGSPAYGGSYDLAMQVTTVPEPSSAALLGLGGLALILRRRK